MSKKKIIITVISTFLFLSSASIGVLFGFYYYLPKIQGEIKALQNDYQDFCQEVQQVQFWEQDFLVDFKAQKNQFLQQNEELVANLNSNLNLIKINHIKRSLNHLKQQFQELKKKYQQNYEQQITVWQTEIKAKKKNALGEAKQIQEYNLDFYDNKNDQNKKYFLQQSQVIFNNLNNLRDLDSRNLTTLNRLNNVIDNVQNNITKLKTFFRQEQLMFLSDLIIRIEKLSLNDGHDKNLMFLIPQVEEKLPQEIKNLNVTHVKQQINTILSSINSHSDLKQIKKQLEQQVKKVENLIFILDKQESKLRDQMKQKIKSLDFNFDLAFFHHNQNLTFMTVIKKIEDQQKNLLLLQQKFEQKSSLFVLSNQMQLFDSWQENFIALKNKLISLLRDLYRQNLSSFLAQINHKMNKKMNFYFPLIEYLKSQNHSWFQENFLKDITSFLLQPNLKLIGDTETTKTEYIRMQYQKELINIKETINYFYCYIYEMSRHNGSIYFNTLKEHAYSLNETITKIKNIKLTVDSNNGQFDDFYKLLIEFDQKKEKIDNFLMTNDIM